MADEADTAGEKTELFLRAALSNKKNEGPVPCGYCYNCGETLTGDARFCDTDCRDDWERREKQTG